MNDYKPFVSFILVTRNEEKYIGESINSIINQTYPKERYELIIVDGMSTDRTRDIIEKIANDTTFRFPMFKIRIFENKNKILSSGWNIGIKKSIGDFVVRIDAHAVASPDFLELSVATMDEHEAVCVGGKIISKSLDGDNEAVSKVLSSPFGVGNSSFRTSEKEGYVDTAVYGLYDKTIFAKVGYFNESFVRNQDMEFHSRVKKSGGKFYFNPKIRSVYYTRNTFKKMLKQGFQNGKWNMVLLKKDLKGPSIRHLVPFAFVLFIVLCLGTGFLFYPIWLLCVGVVLLHLLLGLIFAIKKTKKPKEFLIMPFMFLLLHISYGLGFFAGIFYRIKKGEEK